MVTIRQANLRDVAVLQSLYTHLISDDVSAPLDVAAGKLRALQTYAGSCVLLALDGGTAVATVTLIIVPNMTRQGAPYAFIENVVTNTDHRGRGHAKALLAEADAWAWAAGCYRIMIVSGNHNMAAHKTNLAAGYQGSKTGFQKRRIPDRPLN